MKARAEAKGKGKVDYTTSVKKILEILGLDSRHPHINIIDTANKDISIMMKGFHTSNRIGIGKTNTNGTTDGLEYNIKGKSKTKAMCVGKKGIGKTDTDDLHPLDMAEAATYNWEAGIL